MMMFVSIKVNRDLKDTAACSFKSVSKHQRELEGLTCSIIYAAKNGSASRSPNKGLTCFPFHSASHSPWFPMLQFNDYSPQGPLSIVVCP